MQRLLAPRADEMVGLGVPDLRPDALPAHLADLLADEDRCSCRRAGRHHAAQLAAAAGGPGPLRATGATSSPPPALPPSLQHDDLHDANIFVPYDGVGPYRVFDWGDASVAHPFATLLVTLRVVADRLELADGAPELLRLRDAYLEPWTGEHDRATLVEAVPAGAADRPGRARPVLAAITARRHAVGARAPRRRRARLARRPRRAVRRWTPIPTDSEQGRFLAPVLAAQHPAYLVHRVLQRLLESRHLGVGGLVAAQDLAELLLEALGQPLEVGAARTAAA